MIEILRHIQNNYIPLKRSLTGDSEVAEKIRFGGDQLTEERAINVQKAFLDGDTCFEKLQGPDPKFEDFHLKMVLYEVNNCLSYYLRINSLKRN